MNINERDQLQRAVRDAVFLAERLRRAGQAVAATEVLESELAAAQGRLGADGTPDAAGVVRQWHTEAEAAFSLAQLISQLVVEQIQSSDTPQPAPSLPPPSHIAPPPPGTPSVPTRAPAPLGLADLLDGMLTEERKGKRPPP